MPPDTTLLRNKVATDVIPEVTLREAEPKPMPLLSFSTRHVRTEAHSENTCYDKVGDWNYAEVAKSFSKQPEARERSGEIRGRF